MRILFLLLLATLPLPAYAQNLPSRTLTDAVRDVCSSAKLSPSVEEQQLKFVIAFNCSANKENGAPGRALRNELRRMMNDFLVDKERLTLLTFQLDTPYKDRDKKPVTDSLSFTAADRRSHYSRIETLLSTEGDTTGGGDVELAKYRLLSSLVEPGPTVIVVLTNHEISQRPTGPVAGWSGLFIDRDGVTKLDDASREASVVWQKFMLPNWREEGVNFPTYAHIAVRGGSPPNEAIPNGRARTVADQNKRYPIVPASALALENEPKTQPQDPPPPPPPPPRGNLLDGALLAAFIAAAALVGWRLFGKERVAIGDPIRASNQVSMMHPVYIAGPEDSRASSGDTMIHVFEDGSLNNERVVEIVRSFFGAIQAKGLHGVTLSLHEDGAAASSEPGPALPLPRGEHKVTVWNREGQPVDQLDLRIGPSS